MGRPGVVPFTNGIEQDGIETVSCRRERCRCAIDRLNTMQLSGTQQAAFPCMCGQPMSDGLRTGSYGSFHGPEQAASQDRRAGSDESSLISGHWWST